MADSAIEWTDKVWNPITGCSKVSQGCKNCYAEREWVRLSKNPKQPDYFGRVFTDVQFHPHRLITPFEWKKSARIFVNSMSDLFHESLSWKSIGYVFAVMMLNPRHVFQVLTKRPERMLEFLTIADIKGKVVAQACEVAEMLGQRISLDVDGKWPLPNLWLGVSVEDQRTANERIPLLLNTPAVVRWISAEPLLGMVDLGKIIYEVIGTDGKVHYRRPLTDPKLLLEAKQTPGYSAAGLDWVVVGGESGPKARPMQAEWAQSIRSQCETAGVKFFFKQWGEYLPPDQDGAPGDDQHLNCSNEYVRIGKKAAGRLLDGVEWNQYPEVPLGTL